MPPSGVAAVRKNQIIRSAMEIIAEQGVQHCSLGEIESRAGMSRGQLTYYFPTKEEIFLAVFDALVEDLHNRITGPPSGVCGGPKTWTEFVEILEKIAGHDFTGDPFLAVKYSFLAQVGHRDDYRRKLADLFAAWRNQLSEDLNDALPGLKLTKREKLVLAGMIQSILHGMTMQNLVDPEAPTPLEQIRFLARCVDALYLEKSTEPPMEYRLRAEPNAQLSGAGVVQ